MPQIPVFAEAQVLTPGNPVPIGEADTPLAGAMGQLGKAMEDLGVEMDREQKAKKSKIAQYNVQAALEDYEMQMRTYNQDTLWNDPDSRGDITGLTARKKSIEEGNRLAEAMAADAGFSSEQIAMFNAGRKKVQNQLDPDLMIKSSAESEKEYRASVQNTMNKMASQVSQDPTLFADRMAQVELDVAEDPFARNKPLEVRDRQKNLVMGVYNNFRYRHAFKEAKTFLTQNSHLFSPDELSKEFNALDSDNTSFVNRRNTEEIRADRNYDKQVQELQSTKAVMLYAEIEAAAASGAFAVDAVKQKVMLEGLRGQAGDGSGISREATTQLLNHQPTAQKNIDETYVGKMLSRAFESGNFANARRETNKRFEAGLLSPPTYAKAIKEIGRYEQFQRNRSQDKTWDISKEAYRTMIDYYKSIGKDPTSLDSVQTRKMYNILFSVLNEAQKQQAAGGTVNINQIMSNAAKGFGAEYGKPAMNTPIGVQRPTGSVEDIKKLLRDKAIQIKNGNLSIEQRRAIQQDMMNLKDQLKQRETDEIIRGNNAGPTSSGTRSSNAVQRTR